MELTPKIIKGDSVYDNRGSLTFINDLDLISTKRFYIVENFQKNFIRAWHAHKNEQKIIVCIQGCAQISAVQVNDFDNPSKDTDVKNFYLSENNTECIFIPSGYANGFMSLKNNTKLLIFSNFSLKESINDDYRYPYDYWNCWDIKFR